MDLIIKHGLIHMNLFWHILIKNNFSASQSSRRPINSLPRNQMFYKRCLILKVRPVDRTICLFHNISKCLFRRFFFLIVWETDIEKEFIRKFLVKD